MSAPVATFDDEVVLAARMKEGRDRIVAELRKLIVGPGRRRRAGADLAVRGRQQHHHRRPRAGQDPHRAHAGPGAGPEVLAHPVHARPHALGHHGHRHHPGGSRNRPAAARLHARARSSPTSCWRTRSTARRPRRSPRCSRPCRSTASPCRARPTSCEEPFFVFATQNPIELEGTYPLPEAQLDRFMFDIVIDYLPAGAGGWRWSRPPPPSRTCASSAR